jgi:hypothetical protein
LARNALALLVCAGVLASSFEAHRHAVDDLACLIPLVAHDASAHRVGAEPAPSPSADHCVFCHWARAFRLTASAARRLAARQAESGARVVHVAVTLAAAPALSNLPARAPPQFS